MLINASANRCMFDSGVTGTTYDNDVGGGGMRKEAGRSNSRPRWWLLDTSLCASEIGGLSVAAPTATPSQAPKAFNHVVMSCRRTDMDLVPVPWANVSGCGGGSDHVAA